MALGPTGDAQEKQVQGMMEAFFKNDGVEAGPYKQETGGGTV